ncbi:DNA polymerase family X [uncultured virus]|nr:DNA polymerase family X [uncultured virus]
MQGKSWEAKADAKAITTIEGLPMDLTSGAQALELKLPNIGKGIAKHIDEILSSSDPFTTGVAELDRLPSDTRERIEAYLDLMQVTGVGIKKAEKYYNEGYRTAAALVKAKGLTHREAVGVTHTEKLKRRVPRERVAEYEAAINRILEQLNETYGSNIAVTIAGSYRRGMPTSGDIDAILASQTPGEVAKYWPTILATLQDRGYITEILSEGPERFDGIAALPGTDIETRIDFIFINDIWEYPYALLYFTGSKEFNIKMRQAAKKQGFELSNTFLTDTTGAKVRVSSEEDIFAKLGQQYVAPTARNL